jgi:ribonuclease BN (tRNA processing enzyme)
MATHHLLDDHLPCPLRRRVVTCASLSAIVPASLLAGCAQPAARQTPGQTGAPATTATSKATRVVLLGTKGGPRVGGARANPSTLLLIGGVPYLVDCGSGVSRQMVTAGVPLNTLRHIFITHHHSDHNLEYGGVVYNAWVTGLNTAVHAYGPPPLAQMTRDFLSYMRFDIETRMADEGRPDLRPLLVPHEFDKPGLLMSNDDVKVTSGRVRHPPIEHAYAYRFDTADRSVVISGDTTYSPELIELAKGADVLIHEILYPPAIDKLLARVPNAVTLRKHLLDSHTIPEDVGKVAAQAGVKKLVLSHFVPGDDETITDNQWLEGVRKHYAGPIALGRDLMEV